MSRLVKLIAAALLLALPSLAAAQGARCAPPATPPVPRLERVDPAQVRRTPIRRYTLALSWSPTHCAGRIDGDDRFQCTGDTRFGFVLHGLWPEGEGRDWPQYCAPASPLPPTTLRRNLCMTPSSQLLQHEWTRHGVCMARNPDAYFARAQQLYNGIRIPDMVSLARTRGLTVGDVAAAFAAANRGMRAEMLSIQTERRSGALDEVRVCLDIRQRWASCPRFARGAPAGVPVNIPF